MNNIKALCVFCGANPGAKAIYSKSTETLANMLVNNNIKLIYGGATLGLMGDIANNVLKLGGEAIGVIPKVLVDKELAHRGLTKLYEVETMHERKALMADLSDGFILCPGGIGSLEEFFEIWTWSQLGIHNKPYGILNIDNYYNQLICFLEHTAKEQFVHNLHVEKLITETDPEELLIKFKEYIPLKLNKWLQKENI